MSRRNHHSQSLPGAYNRSARKRRIVNDELFGVGLLAMSETVWMCCNGSMELCDEGGVVAEYVAYMRKRLSEWRPPSEDTARKDNAVRELLLAVLDDHDRRCAECVCWAYPKGTKP